MMCTVAAEVAGTLAIISIVGRHDFAEFLGEQCSYVLLLPPPIHAQ